MVDSPWQKKHCDRLTDAINHGPWTIDYGLNKNMLREIDSFFIDQPEPAKGCLLFLREFILAYDKNITEAWKYKMPFYCYKGEMFCYLWADKKTKQPYIGIVEGRKIEHPLLMIEKRSRMKIMKLDATEDIPVQTIDTILKMALEIYKSASPGGSQSQNETEKFKTK